MLKNVAIDPDSFEYGHYMPGIGFTMPNKQVKFNVLFEHGGFRGVYEAEVYVQIEEENGPYEMFVAAFWNGKQRFTLLEEELEEGEPMVTPFKNEVNKVEEEILQHSTVGDKAEFLSKNYMKEYEKSAVNEKAKWEAEVARKKALREGKFRD